MIFIENWAPGYTRWKSVDCRAGHWGCLSHKLVGCVRSGRYWFVYDWGVIGFCYRTGGTSTLEGDVPSGRWAAVRRLLTLTHRPGGTGAPLAGGGASEAFWRTPANTVHLDNHYNKYHPHNINNNNNNKPNNNLNNDLSGCGLRSLSRNNLGSILIRSARDFQGFTIGAWYIWAWE